MIAVTRDRLEVAKLVDLHSACDTMYAFAYVCCSESEPLSGGASGRLSGAAPRAVSLAVFTSAVSAPSRRSPRARRSAGIVLYRHRGAGIEVLLVHPGGPVWAKRDLGAWSIPKGEYGADDDPLGAALREFEEELGSKPPEGEPDDLGEIKQKSGKVVHAWALRRRPRRHDGPQQHARARMAASIGQAHRDSGGRPGRVVRSEGGSREDQRRPGRIARPPAGAPALSPSSTISPTAHYTGYVWARNGLSHPELSTTEGRVLFESLRPAIAVSRALGGSSLETYLLARHRAIDVLLGRAIEDAGVGQVIEVACGLSPRGWRFTERYGERLTYIEADLPEMAARKRRALAKMGSLSDRHRVVDLDALADRGSRSLDAVTAELDRGEGLAIITEGLLGYLPGDAVESLWRRFASALSDFSSGRYISDLHLGGAQTIEVRAFRVVLSAFVRGRVHLHFEDATEAVAALQAAGFERAHLHRAVALAPGDPGSRTGAVTYT